jgi:DNA-binding beta-propeller fold protein YncE
MKNLSTTALLKCSGSILALALASNSGTDAAQQVELRDLFRARAELPQPAVGYEIEPAWPSDPDEGRHDGAVSAIDIDAGGRVWVLGRGRVPVRVFDTRGNLVRAWGEGRFGKPHGLGFDAEGNVWIADVGRHVVEKFTPTGDHLLTLGTPGEAGTDSTHFDQPTDVAVAPDGEVFVSDGYGNNRIARFDTLGRFLGSFGTEGSGPGEFRLPHALIFDARGRLYVADRSNARVQIFDRTGRFLSEWRNLIVPWDLALAPDGEILAVGSTPMRRAGSLALVPLGIPPKDQVVLKLDPSGRVRELWAFPIGRSPAGSLDWVHGLAADEDGHLYLGDIQGQRVQKFRRVTDSPSGSPIDRGVERAGGRRPMEQR